MTAVYFDASVILAILLDEERAKDASEMWDQYPERVGSILLEAECLIGLRRFAALSGKRLPAKWLTETTQALDAMLAEVNLLNVDPTVLSSLRREQRLAECRSQDALHLATALLFASRSEDRFRLITFDDRMRIVAKSLGFDVLPTK